MGEISRSLHGALSTNTNFTIALCYHKKWYFYFTGLEALIGSHYKLEKQAVEQRKF